MTTVLKTIAVTGAGGFLGREIVKQALMMPNVRVVACTNSSTLIDELRFLDLAHEDRIKILGRDPRQLSSYEGCIDVLVNCAFPRSVDGICLAAGLEYTEQLFNELSRLKNIESYINISSQSVYGASRTYPSTEATPLCLDDPYAACKRCTEILADIMLDNMEGSSIRLGSLIGVGLNQRVLNKLILQSLNNQGIRIASRNQQFDFLDVRDAAAALLKMCSFSSKDWKPIYNLGAGKSVSLMQIAQYATDAADAISCKKTKIEVTSAEQSKEVGVMLDSSLFHKQFSWRPRYSIFETAQHIARVLAK